MQALPRSGRHDSCSAPAAGRPSPPEAIRAIGPIGGRRKGLSTREPRPAPRVQEMRKPRPRPARQRQQPRPPAQPGVKPVKAPVRTDPPVRRPAMEPSAYARIRSNPKFQQLVRQRNGLARILTVAMLVIYLSFILLVAFGRGLLGTPI